jgi:hypothetical protein
MSCHRDLDLELRQLRRSQAARAIITISTLQIGVTENALLGGFHAAVFRVADRADVNGVHFWHAAFDSTIFMVVPLTALSTVVLDHHSLAHGGYSSLISRLALSPRPASEICVSPHPLTRSFTQFGQHLVRRRSGLRVGRLSGLSDRRSPVEASAVLFIGLLTSHRWSRE